MIYKDFKDKKLSALGFGAMRLPVVEGREAEVNRELTRQMVTKAMDSGINYYDTAWGYHEGNSELVMNEALAAYPRESYYLADKFPGYDLANMSKAQEIFHEQMKKCGTDYFDFYLFHNVCEMNIDEYLNPEHGLLEFFLQMKAEGHIRHLGFSCHGRAGTLRRFLEAYGEHMEFCQIQLNWFDWSFQNAKESVDILKEYDLPIWVMEPVRGGRLLNLDEKYTVRLNEMRPDRSLADWAFRFLLGIDSVTVVLSGMSDMEQLTENIDIFCDETKLSAEENNTLIEIGEEMGKTGTLPCTACRYCTSHCPQGLDIPDLISMYNQVLFKKGEADFISTFAAKSLDEDKQPSACLHCHSCEPLCPQQIKISDAMQGFEDAINAFFAQ